MPELKNREDSEALIESAVMSILRRWKREIQKATATIQPLIVNQTERESLQIALSDPFGRAAKNLATELSLPIDDSLFSVSALFLANFADAIADGLASVTNRKIAVAVAELAAEDAQAATNTATPRKSIESVDIETKGLRSAARKLGLRVLDKIKDSWLSAKRAATVAITETTRMVTAGERIVANVWNRTIGGKTGLETQIAEAIGGEQSTGQVVDTSQPRFSEPHRLVARLFTQGDERVCPLCGPLDGLYEWEWPAAAKGGTPIHTRCRCWLEWDAMPISKIPVG